MRRGALAAALLVLATAFAGLGAWQVERRAAKLELIAKVNARLRAAPRPLPGEAEWDRDLAYTRVQAIGTFQHDRETLVRAVTELGGGWWVLTPLRTGAVTVLVNRGFVPPERANLRTRAAGQVSGIVTVTGLLRASEPGRAFLRGNDAAAGRWYSRDVTAIARARGLGRTAPFFIDADATPNSGGLPVGGLTIVAFRNSHLAYALTWFVLAGLALGGAVLVLRDGRLAPGRALP